MKKLEPLLNSTNIGLELVDNSKIMDYKHFFKGANKNLAYGQHNITLLTFQSA